MITKNNEEIEINMKELALLLLHKLWIILIIGILFAGGAFALSKYLIKPVYTSSTNSYIVIWQEENRMTFADLQSGAQLTKDYMILVKSRPVLDQVIKELGLSMNNVKLASKIEVNNPDDTRILEISVNDTDPVIAKKLADTITEVTARQMVSIMELVKVNVVEWGNLPTGPSSPNIVKNSIFGGLAGAFLASIIIVLVSLMNDSIRTTEDIEKYLDMTTLGVIPMTENKMIKKSKKHNKREVALAS
jgi:capsular polysaccharide biosynthesis protein